MVQKAGGGASSSSKLLVGTGKAASSSSKSWLVDEDLMDDNALDLDSYLTHEALNGVHCFSRSHGYCVQPPTVPLLAKNAPRIPISCATLFSGHTVACMDHSRREIGRMC